MSKIPEILTGVANGLDATADSLSDPIERAATHGAAVVVRTIVAVIGDRTDTEALALLEKIRDHGVTPISQGDLDRQVKDAIDRG